MRGGARERVEDVGRVVEARAGRVRQGQIDERTASLTRVVTAIDKLQLEEREVNQARKRLLAATHDRPGGNLDLAQAHRVRAEHW